MYKFVNRILFLLSTKKILIPDLDLKDKNEIIKYMSERIASSFVVPDNFLDEILEREAFKYRLFKSHCHASPLAVKHGRIACVAILKKPVMWENNYVRLVIMTTVHHGGENLQPFYDYLTRIITSAENTDLIVKQRDYLTLKRILLSSDN